MQSKKKTSYLYFWSFIALGLIAGLLGPSLPAFAANTGSSLRQLSSLFLLSSLGYMLGSYGVGLYLNKVKGHRVIAAALFFMAIFVGLLPVVKSLWLLVAIFFFLGVAQSHLDVGENTLLIWLHGSQVTGFMNGLHFFFGVGTLLAPLLIAQTLRLFDSISVALWMIAIFIILPSFFILRQPSPPELTHAQADQRNQGDKSQLVLVLFLVGMFFGFVGAEVTFGGWIYTYSLNIGLTNPQTAAYLSAVYWAAFTIARLSGILLTSRISVRTMMWFNLVGCFVSILIILIWSQSAFILWLCTFAFGFFIATTFPVGMNLAERLGVVSAKVTSWFFISASLTSMISPWIVGQFFENWSPTIVMWVIFGNIAIALLFYSLTRRAQPAR